MANWQRTLDISDSWGKIENNSITIQEISKQISKKLLELAPFNISSIDTNKNHLIEIFDELSESIDMIDYLTEDFDRALFELYDWGDTKIGIIGNKRVCWIKTL